MESHGRALRAVAVAARAGLVAALATGATDADASPGTVQQAGTTTTAAAQVPALKWKPAAGPVSDCLTLASPTCYTPLQFRTAYGIQPLTNRGITGKGETVVLPEEAAWRGEPLLKRHPARSR